jgi:hypothetical protein
MEVSAVMRARRNWASAWENVSYGCGNGGGGLGGQRGDDCRIDLGLKGCGGFRHPKINGIVAWSWGRRQQQLKTEEKTPKNYLTCRRNSELWLE